MGHFLGEIPDMSKCHVQELEHVYRAVFRDALYAFPTLEADFEKDLTRLLVAVERRGLRVYLEDLPAIGKHLDRCLSVGQYNLSGLPLTKRLSGRVPIPRFLRGLYLLVFHSDGRLKEDCNTDAIFFLRQICYAAKKAKVSCSSKRIKRTVREFIAVDAGLPEPEGYWQVSDPVEYDAPHPYFGFSTSVQLRARCRSLPSPRRAREALIFLMTLDTVSNIIATILGPYRPEEWRFRHGPGAISEVVGPTNKYRWTNWSNLLESEYPIADFGFHHWSSWAGGLVEKSRSIDSHEPSSRLVAVPKDFRGPRLIAAEPSEHMWCQQNFWHYVRTRTRDTLLGGFITFRDQSTNQELCVRASQGGAFATVDLSSASDRVTPHVVGQLFRSNPGLLKCLRASRTRVVTQSIVHEAPETVSLRKFSTMGSACTFPVQSLTFLAIALSAVLCTRKMRPTMKSICDLTGEVAVFGDDIVVPTDCRELFEDALEVLYFKVNPNKTFWTGMFRESCGVDSYSGVNVTPVYWKQPFDGGPESLASVVECANNYYEKWLINTADYLASTVPWDIPGVCMSSGVFGLKTRCIARNTHLKRRYNPFYQRVEILVRSLFAKQVKSPIEDDTALLQFFTEEPDPYILWGSGVPQKPLLHTERRWVAEETLTSSSQRPLGLSNDPMMTLQVPGTKGMRVELRTVRGTG